MIDPGKFGISFSIKQCRNFSLDPHETLNWLLDQGWRRFRLMSYWNEHEKQPGEYNFEELDWQVEAITKAGGTISLCLGVKQPRWPEYHWPKWTWDLPEAKRSRALLNYVEAVVKHYRSQPTITSWQLENEALLSNFGSRIDINRKRLRQEFRLVKSLDSSRPIIMSTSNGWGTPVRRPHPDIVGFSQYFTRHQKGAYRTTKQPPLLHRLRKHIVRASLQKPVLIHELQLEPWGPQPIWKMDRAEQDKSMGTKQIRHNIVAAESVGAYPIDCWGAEWWYWRYRHGDHSIWQAVSEAVQ